MLLAWVQAFLVSNMLLAEAYRSGGCLWDNGHLYRADQLSPAPGLRCLNWLDVQSRLASAPVLGKCPPGDRAAAAAAGLAGGSRGPGPSPGTRAGNHSYCRNPDEDPRGPWCYVSGEAGVPDKRPCEDLRCPGTARNPGNPRARGLQGAAATRSARAAARGRLASLRPRAVRLARAISRPRGSKPIGRSRRSYELIRRERL
ncbi:Phosphoinositide-3-kinase-interacting protein 1 [Saguinus oedipus]|uniref:Phosphoinositide-3-kinase-interacting protein 1 n=1 Tax=Saguinus oedipus TaxID=9490 RepID=A0ABQ9WIB7_SAGOE|nr:Phosphoinositide-3-kinase-interacting protein 1 [Saguinus oedipus]